MSKRMNLVGYIDELVDATIRTRAMGDCLLALGSRQGGFDDGTIAEVGEIVLEQAERLEGTIARLGDDICVAVV